MLWRSFESTERQNDWLRGLLYRLNCSNCRQHVDRQGLERSRKIVAKDRGSGDWDEGSLRLETI